MTAAPIFRICTLFSGSKGNCTYIRYGETRILIDAGMSCHAIERGLGAIGDSLSAVRAVFLTHEHSDHTKALPVLCKKFALPVHAPSGTVRTLAGEGYATDCLLPHPPCFSVTVTDERGEDPVTLRSFPTSHDASVSVGYRIETPSGCAALATDTGCVTDDIRNAFRGCTAAVIESNHDENMLLMGSYPYELKRRILSDCGHLSNAACGEFARELVKNGVTHRLLAHLSPENNTPELAYLTVRTALTQAGYTEGEDYTLAVAPRDAPAFLMEGDDGYGYPGII